jgi:hypothetical protein
MRCMPSRPLEALRALLLETLGAATPPAAISGREITAMAWFAKFVGRSGGCKANERDDAVDLPIQLGGQEGARQMSVTINCVDTSIAAHSNTHCSCRSECKRLAREQQQMLAE